MSICENQIKVKREGKGRAEQSLKKERRKERKKEIHRTET